MLELLVLHGHALPGAPTALASWLGSPQPRSSWVGATGDALFVLCVTPKATWDHFLLPAGSPGFPELRPASNKEEHSSLLQGAPSWF